MADIGKMNLKLTANPSEFEKGINVAKKSLASLGGKFTDLAAQAADGAIFSAAAQGAQSLVKEFGELASKIPVVGGAFAALAGGLVGVVGSGFALLSFLKSTYKEWKETAAAAQAAGVQLDDYQVLMRQAGDNQEAMRSGLEHLVRTLGEAKQGSKEATDAFKTLGLDPFGQSSSTVYRSVLDQLKAIEDQSQRAAAAHKLFGKAASEILPIIDRGGAGFDALKKKMEENGSLFKSADINDAKAGLAAIKEIETAFEGVKNQIAVGMLPAVQALTGEFGGASLTLGKFSENVVAASVAFARLATLIPSFKEMFGPGAALYVKRLATQADPGAAILRAYRQQLESRADDLQKRPEDLEGARDQARIRSNIDFFDELTRKTQFGEGALGKYREGFSKLIDLMNAGALKTGIPFLSVKLLPAFEQLKKDFLTQAGLLTPLEKLQEEALAIQKNAGNLDNDILARMAGKAVAGFNTNQPAAAPPSALAEGSIEALSAVNAAARNQPKTQEQRLTEIREKLELQRQIEAESRDFQKLLLRGFQNGEFSQVANL